MLPMLPIYISYFAGNADKKGHILSRAIAFVFGFSIVFTGLGLFAGTLSGFLIRYQQVVQIVCGLIVIIFGLSYLDIFHLPFFKGMQKPASISSIFSALVFGMIYSVSLTPCVGTFLGAALMQAGLSGGAIKGGLLLLAYSLGLGIPFLISGTADRRQVIRWVMSMRSMSPGMVSCRPPVGTISAQKLRSGT